ncbi:hypothetical protein LBMAG52_42110 [Planctomycetia bacterium]|nr:hypothetical protein LBMAG52_42110 [Planctomycetia bacterium]
MVNNSQISAGYEDDPAKGQRVLQKYRVDDVVIAYASGSGAIGYGIIGDPSSYIHLVKGHPDDRLNGVHLHRLSIQWQAVIPNLANAVKPARFGLTHPIPTSCRIMDEQNAEKLTDYLRVLGNRQ